MSQNFFKIGLNTKAYYVNIVIDIKPIYLNKRYLFQNEIYYLDKIYLFRKNKVFQTYSV